MGNLKPTRKWLKCIIDHRFCVNNNSDYMKVESITELSDLAY